MRFLQLCQGPFSLDDLFKALFSLTNHALYSLRALRLAVERANKDDSVHVIVLRGAGRAFCAGYDLIEFAQRGFLYQGREAKSKANNKTNQGTENQQERFHKTFSASNGETWDPTVLANAAVLLTSPAFEQLF